MATPVKPTSTTPLRLERADGQIWSHLRQKSLLETPEERVRQEYLLVLVNEYGFSLAQMDEELEVTGRGSGRAKADFVIWRTVQDKADKLNPLIVVETKSDNVTISVKDYGQGDNYSRLTGARFFVTHNTRETRYWRVVHEQMPKTFEEIENIPTADASNKEIEELVKKLKVFKEDEFAALLHRCHNIIRNREKMDPAAAFDEIAKILFVKVWVERELRAKRSAANLFTVEFLDTQVGEAPVETLFEKTKAAYRANKIFHSDDRINLKPATAREIVRELERYNLSDTSEDVKGIAFERFLGRTFRGEIGQFFTPRPIVEFMIRMMSPVEGETVCDPASGSGGFLIRFFEIVREQILADADKQYAEKRAEIEAAGLEAEDEAAQLRDVFDAIQRELRSDLKNSRMWRLANTAIFGTDANDRMARTSKMNMIMHGDGHGGVHHHDGFVNVNGIFEGRFDIVLTNPPFGASVEATDLVEIEKLPPDTEDRYRATYGKDYEAARAKVEAAVGRPLSSLFTLPRGGAIKTELLFIERCLDLLRPGGRMGIVLPEGVFNNSSLAYVRDYVEQHAYIRAVVSLPEGTFRSAKASVKASLLFLQKFDASDQARFDAAGTEAKEAIADWQKGLADEIDALDGAIEKAKKKKDRDQQKELTKQRRLLTKEVDQRVADRLKAEVKARFDYPVFMYDATSVGITPTGAHDFNELYLNERMPPDLDKTCLELYEEFLTDPEPFLLKFE